MNTQRYVAMGSSFGAGPGLKPRAAHSPRAAGRSASNYAHLVATRAGLDLVDVTFSGATVRQMLTGGPGDRPSQLGAVDGSTSLVTITGGGNDVEYLPALTLASFPLPLATLFGGRRRLNSLLDEASVDLSFVELESDLRSLVTSIHDRAPGARVMIVGYLTILPPLEQAAPPLGQSVHRWGLRVAARLAETMSDVAVATGAEFVDVGEASREHDAWATEPWTRRFHYSLRGGAPYHPSYVGMRKVSEQITTRLSRS